jgi:hypothetical protein
VAVTAVPSLAARGNRIPKELRVPEGHRLVLSALGQGVQIYDCSAAGAWTLREPAAAILKGDTTVALHYAGPTWQSVKDGSKVVARPEPERRVVVPAPHPERDIPWLRLETIGTGPGLFGQVDFIQRLRTRGGVAPAGACQAGASTAVPYTATYNFWTPANLDAEFGTQDESRRGATAGPQPSDQQRTTAVTSGQEQWRGSQLYRASRPARAGPDSPSHRRSPPASAWFQADP